MNLNYNLRHKPSQVIIWGLGSFTRQYIEYLNQADIKVAKCVDSQLYGTTVENIAIISPQQYADQFYLYKDIPLVITDIEQKGENTFNEHLEYLSNHPEINPKILHPAFIADYIKLNHSGRIYCLGFMGAGNVLLQNVLIEIMNKYSRISSQKEQQIGYFAYHYLSGLRTHVNDFFKGNDLPESTIGTFQEESCFVQLSSDWGNYIHFSGIITKNYLYEDITGSHATISNQFLKILLERNYQVFLAVRNPLEIIVSFASKYSSPKYVKSIINNLDWFASTAIVIKKYYEDYCKFQDIKLIKYEDLIFDSLKTIKYIAEILKVYITESEVESIWKKIGFKELRVRHLWRPGIGKWKEYFTKTHIDILKSLGYENFLRELGYENMMENLCYPELSKEVEHLSQKAEKTISLFDYLYHAWYDKPIIFTDKNIMYKCNNQPRLHIVSNSDELMNSLDNALKSSRFLNYIKALEVNEVKKVNKSAEIYLNNGLEVEVADNLYEATNSYQKALDREPNCIEAMYQLAEVCLTQGKLSEAIAYYQKALIEVKPSFVLTIGKNLEEEGRLDEAIVFYEKSIYRNPNIAIFFLQLGNVFLKQDKHEEAIHNYEKALTINTDLELNAELVNAYLNCGYKLKQQDRQDELVAIYQRAVTIKPELAQIHLHLGNIFLEKERFNEASHSYQMAIEMNPILMEAYTNLIRVQRHQCNFKDALICCEKMIKINPDYAEGYQNLGDILLLQGKRTDAFKNYSRYLQVKFNSNPSIPGVLLNTILPMSNLELIGYLVNGLQIPTIKVSTINFPDAKVISDQIKKLALGRKISVETISAEKNNLHLISGYLDKIIIHISEPRYATLLWVEYLEKLKNEMPSILLEESCLFCEEYFLLSLREQISWQIEKGYLPEIIKFIEGWLNAEEDSGFHSQILFTHQEDLSENPKSFFDLILNFYTIEKQLFTFPDPLQEGQSHDQGSVDRWREVFTLEQSEKASSMIPRRLLDRFGWSDR